VYFYNIHAHVRMYTQRSCVCCIDHLCPARVGGGLGRGRVWSEHTQPRSPISHHHRIVVYVHVHSKTSNTYTSRHQFCTSVRIFVVSACCTISICSSIVFTPSTWQWICIIFWLYGTICSCHDLEHFANCTSPRCWCVTNCGYFRIRYSLSNRGPPILPKG
jgi:hypothetical protein